LLGIEQTWLGGTVVVGPSAVTELGAVELEVVELVEVEGRLEADWGLEVGLMDEAENDD
jgi:hypothetical protein